MEWILWVFGYLAGGLLTARWGYNIVVTNKYRYYMKSFTVRKDFEAEKASLAEDALKQAKADMIDTTPFIVLGAFWGWPIYLVGILIYKANNVLPRINVLKSKAEREVYALRADKALSDARKTEWDNALRTMDEAGISTKELRKIKID